MPTDLRRLAQNLTDLSYTLRINIPDIWAIVDTATAAGGGTKTANLSPLATIIAELINARGAALFDPLGHPKSRDVFIPLEVTLPAVSSDIAKRIVRPPA